MGLNLWDERNKFDTLRGRENSIAVVFSTGCGSTSLTNHTRGSATADTVLRSLTPYQGSGFQLLNVWNQDHEVVEPFNSPRCNLGKRKSGLGIATPKRVELVGNGNKSSTLSSTPQGSWGSCRRFVLHGFHPRLLRSLTPAGVWNSLSMI